MEFTDGLVFAIVVGARLLVPLLIPRFPLPAILAALVIDAADQTVFQQLTDLDLDGYQSYDKALDIYYLTIAYISAMRNWASPFAFSVARFLWYYRLVGVVLFEMTEERFLLLLFANTFEYFFIFYEGVRTSWDPARLGRKGVIVAAAGIWIFIKLPQEWWIHVAQLDFTDFMKEDVFGVTPETSWGDALTNRPWVTALLLAAIVGIAVLAYIGSKRLPPRDWAFTVDSDTVGRHLGWTATPTPVPEPVFGWASFEKTALLTLVSAIFAQVLGSNASGLQLLLAVALVVLVNAGIANWRIARGYQWRSTFVQFLVLSVANLVVIGGFAALVQIGDDTEFSLPRAMFFALLLSLIIVLFDRYRRIRSARLIDRGQVDDADPRVGFASD
ncbi:MAG: hypothetical protein OES57_10535 [Acidimicrobiia bacterium]|nr:hypothetical protein [Acidimicrobiia bacterium]